MKELIILEIKSRMIGSISSEQMNKLECVLNEVLFCKDIIETSEQECKEESPINANNHLLNAFIESKQIEGCSVKTLKFYRSTLNAFFATLQKNVRFITTEEIRGYLSAVQTETGCSSTSMDNIRRILSSFFMWMEVEDYILKNPMRRIHKIKTPKILKEAFSEDEIEDLRASCHPSLRSTAIVDFLLSTGIRVGELVLLNRNGINLNERTCKVFGKGSKEREVYFDVRAKKSLENYLKSRTDDNPALFVSLRNYKVKNGHIRMSIEAVEGLVRKIGKNAGVRHVHPHRFRRTLATRAIDKGMPIELVQFLLGHTKIDTTLRYAIVKQNNVRSAHQKFLC